MFERLLKALSDSAWRPGFVPGSSVVLDVERGEPDTASSRNTNYREQGASSVVDQSAITAITYTCHFTIQEGEDTRYEYYLRRVETSAEEGALLAWEHRISHDAFMGRWIARLGDAVIATDETGCLVARDARSGEARWRSTSRPAEALMRLESGALRVLGARNTWTDLDPTDGRTIDGGGWRLRREREALIRDHLRIGGNGWKFARARTPLGELIADEPHLRLESVSGGTTETRTISFAPWRTWNAFVRCRDTIVVWLYRADVDECRLGALAVLDADTLEQVGWIDLGKGPDSLMPTYLSVCGRYVLVSAELGRDRRGKLVPVVSLVDVPAQRVIASFYRHEAHFHALGDRGAFSVPL